MRRESAKTPKNGDLDAMPRLDHCARHERSGYLRHLPGDYSLASNAGCGRLFLIVETQTRPASRPPACVMACFAVALDRVGFDARRLDARAVLVG